MWNGNVCFNLYYAGRSPFYSDITYSDFHESTNERADLQKVEIFKVTFPNGPDPPTPPTPPGPTPPGPNPPGPPSPDDPSTPDEPQDQGKVSTGIIIAIVAGVIVVLLSILGVLYLKRKQRLQEEFNNALNLQI